MALHPRLVPLVLASLLFALPSFQPATLTAQAECTFTPRFQVLHALIPDIVGDCLEQEYLNPESGLVEQRTTGGLLMLRPSDGLTGFTDGTTTWLLGPEGLVSRANTDPPFPWESPAPPAAAPSAPPPTSEPQAKPAETAPPSEPVPPPCSLANFPSVTVVPPAAGFDPKLAAFSGVWQGSWEPRGQFAALPSRLAVRQIDSSQAAVTYTWQGDGAFRGSVNLDAAVLEHGAITWGTGVSTNPRFIFTISGDLQTVSGTRESGAFTDKITMTRCSP